MGSIGPEKARSGGGLGQLKEGGSAKLEGMSGLLGMPPGLI